MASAEQSLRWVPLDNAAKIYPAARTKTWSNVFRLSVTLTETVDVDLLQEALDGIIKRFPTIAARLRRGVFWYYLQEVSQAPAVGREHSFPLVPMGREELRRCAFRVIVYRRRIAVEFFHALTDGNGGLIFLKTLTAEYLRRKYGAEIPAERGVLDPNEPPDPAELEDSFLKYAAPVRASWKDTDAWRLEGQPEADGFRHVTCLHMSAEKLLQIARSYGVSVTSLLAAAMMKALLELQAEQVSDRRKRKHIKVLIPVNLRKLFPSRTLRNFVLYTTPSADPRLGDYSIPELCKLVQHHMGMEVTAKQMSRLIAVNVRSEQIMALRVTPLFLKNMVMKAVFQAVGERKSCLSLSNLGVVDAPAAMRPYVERFDFILGVQATSPYNCGVITWNDRVVLTLIRNTTRPVLEYRLFRVLQSLGVEVTADSNNNHLPDRMEASGL